MSDPCKRCGDPDENHGGQDVDVYKDGAVVNTFPIEPGTAAMRNCNLYRIGTELKKLNDHLEGIANVLHSGLCVRQDRP